MNMYLQIKCKVAKLRSRQTEVEMVINVECDNYSKRILKDD